MSMYAPSFGVIAPSRLMPEPTGAFSLNGGSRREITPPRWIARADNPRLAGLGCDGNRQCAPCAARANLGAFHESGTCYAGPGYAPCTSVEWANYAVAEAISIADAARAIGGPGYLPTAEYYQSFNPLYRRVRALIDDFASTYGQDMPAGVHKAVHDALIDANDTIQQASNGNYEAGMFDRLIDSLRQAGTFTYAVAAETPGTLSDAGEVAKRAAKAAADAAAGALGIGKYVAIAVGAVLLFGLYGRARG